MARVQQLSIEDTNKFSTLFTDYLKEKPELKPFYQTFPHPENLKNYFDEFNAVDRQLLYHSLLKQHKELPLTDKQINNIEALKEQETFTVTTGHQLNLFCGPLYFIYKIVSTIKTCESLAQHYPNKKFVPIFWMASEDHDFEEINHFHLFGKKHTWSTEQQGPVGEMHTKEIGDLFDDIKDLPDLFSAYKTAEDLSQATRQIVNELFKSYGLLILDANDKDLKRALVSQIKKDVLEQTNETLIHEKTKKLEELGYKGQIHPRAINFFYLEQGKRSRIVFENNRFKILGTEFSFSKEEMTTLIETCPERFSPNVALRPLYQQIILPNIAYVGGPGEIAYWLQLKTMFTESKVVFPSLLPRNFGLFIPKNLSKKLTKLKINAESLFQPPHELKKTFISNLGLDFHLKTEINTLTNLLDEINIRACAIDKGLEGAVGAETQKSLKQFHNLEKRIQKVQEKKHEQEIGQVTALQDKLFPKGGLQERFDNFLNFYINDPSFIQKIYDCFAAFDTRFTIITDE